MKNWQFCMLMATIYISPVGAGVTNIVACAVFLVMSAIALVKDRP
jgi:hypothetical protein